MDRTLIIVGSITYAMKAKEILFANGITAYIERTKRTKEHGCGYGLHVPKDTDAAEHLLLQHGVHILARVSRNAS